MDLTIRDWMVIVGVLLIVVVLLDAWRRMRSGRYSRVKLKLSAVEEVGDKEEPIEIDCLRELPNGGARVVERSDLLRVTGQNRAEKALADEADSGEQETPADNASYVAESDPVDTDSYVEENAPTSAPDFEPDRDSESVEEGASDDESVDSEEEEWSSSDDMEDDVPLIEGMNSIDEPGNLDWLDDIPEEQPPESVEEAPAAPGKLPRDVAPEVFMINVMARTEVGFRGEDILQILLACDLRFGDMNFFHRHEFEAGRGAIQFSVANMMQPGVFDIDKMSAFNTPGLVFFLTLPGPEDMMKAFEYMLETAKAVARNLDGDVRDETRSVMTRQAEEHIRTQIRDLERRMMASSAR